MYQCFTHLYHFIIYIIYPDFTKSFDPQTAGLAMSNQEQLREVHNSFARQQVFELEDNSGAKDEDLFHFVGYLPVNGRYM